MNYLIITSLIWATSFSIIKKYLTDIDPGLVALIRMLISLLVFIPLFRPRLLGIRDFLILVTIGAIQYGVMYVAYLYSFQYLMAHQVAIFTIFTPIYVLAVDFGYHHNTNWKRVIIFVLLAIIGSGITVYKEMPSHIFGWGFCLLQLSNLSFAVGQVAYARFIEKRNFSSQSKIYAPLYLGGTLFTLLYFALTTNFNTFHFDPSTQQITGLLYLSLIASGLAFFLWNHGATRVSPALLAIMNNLKIPAGVIVALMVFHSQIDGTGMAKIAIGTLLVLMAIIFTPRS